MGGDYYEDIVVGGSIIKKTQWLLVRKLTIPTGRPPLVDEI
jgi:hypothetical protein